MVVSYYFKIKQETVNIVGPLYLQIPHPQIVMDRVHFIRDLSTCGFSYV